MSTRSHPLTGIAALTATHGDVQVLPTSFAQQRFWVLDQIEGGAAAYTIPVALRLRGALDSAALEGSLQIIVNRHEALRTVFALENEEPVQVVLPSLAIPLAVEDLRWLAVDEREAVVRERASANANASFDLATGPLIRASVLQLADDDQVLVLALHHIVADGWSIGVLYGELERAYEAIVAGREPEMPALPLQYPDYAVWQRGVMQGGGATRQLAYWTERLRDLPVMELPTDRPRPAIQTANGGKRETLLAADVANGMRALARRESVTSYMAFLAAFAVLMHRYSGQDDLVFGSITSGRVRTEVEPLIGLFVNTLAIRVDVESDASFVDLLGRVSERATEAYTNQDVPFDRVVDAVQPTRDRSRNPIFQVAFQLLEALGRELRLPGVTASRVTGAKDTTKFDLTLMLHAAPDGALRAVMEYNSDLFESATVDRMLHHYGVLVAAIVRDPSMAIGLLPIMTAEELTRVVVDCNATYAPVPEASLHGLILEQAARTPNAIAVESDGADGVVSRLTFAELAHRATTLAGDLRELGVLPGVGVGVCLERSCDLVVAMVGVLIAGGHYVPFDPQYPVDRLTYMLEQSRVHVMLTQAELRDRLPLAAARAHVLALDTEWDALAARSSADAVEPAAVSEEDLAYVIYTSGSTGRPKGVMVPHRAVVNYVNWMRTAYPVDTRDAILQKAPASFDACIWEFFLPLVSGARLVLARPAGHQDPAYLADVIQRLGITVLQLVPSQLQMMLETPAFLECTSVRHIFSGGEALPGELLGRLAIAMPSVPVTNLYGPTETTVYSTHWNLERASFDGSAPIGRPIFNTQVYVVDERLQPTPIGIPGELLIGGHGVALGYMLQPELTAEKFIADVFRGAGTMYRTGDRARWRADGTLEYLGRRDNQVKLRGFRIELGEIESVLTAHPSVSAAVAIVREDTPGDKRLVAYVVASGSEVPLQALLREQLREHLPEYMVPSAIVFLTALPTNANGKLDRRALPVPDDAGAAKSYVAPRTPLEAQIAGVWGTVLGRERVGVDDDFFGLGGHSLLAMRVIAQLAELLPVRLTIGALFEARTVGDFSAFVVQRMAQQEVSVSGDDDDLITLLTELEGLSDDDATRLLDAPEATT